MSNFRTERKRRLTRIKALRSQRKVAEERLKLSRSEQAELQRIRAAKAATHSRSKALSAWGNKFLARKDVKKLRRKVEKEFQF